MGEKSPETRVRMQPIRDKMGLQPTETPGGARNAPGRQPELEVQVPHNANADCVNPQTPNIVILVTGSRHAQYEPWADIIAAAILDHTQGEPCELVHGDARGIDRIAETVAFRTNPVNTKVSKITAFPADWKQFGKAAGPRRNVQMRDYCEARQREGARIVCLAFHENLAASKGTRHMVNIIQQLGGITLVVSDGAVTP